MKDNIVEYGWGVYNIVYDVLLKDFHPKKEDAIKLRNNYGNRELKNQYTIVELRRTVEVVGTGINPLDKSP